MNKKYCLTWEQWIEFCQAQKIDPVENCECGIDLGGGDSTTFYCDDEPRREERDES